MSAGNAWWLPAACNVAGGAGLVLGSQQAEYWFEERCYITEWLNDPADPAMSIARARVCPGVTTRWHYLVDIAERYLILAGTGVVETTQLPPTMLSPGDSVLIAPGVHQRITNTGHEDLVFLAICTPRFSAEAYRQVSAESAG